MTIDTSDEKAVERYTYFLEEIEPHVSKFQNDLDLKLNSLPGFDLLDFQGAEILRKNIRKDIDIFREENIPLQTEIQTKAQEYSGIIGAMMIEWNGEEITMPKAGVILQSTDREERKSAY
jgi:oligoendopeptidase F